ncbi:MAG: DUF1080 domain-containing protein [Bryobacterales bacterium]|nr:DUF1080 domain-containing protein [Bryobacterales bacterium]
MSVRSASLIVIAAATCVFLLASDSKQQRSSAPGYDDTPVLPGQPWRVHDIKRPHPPVVTPGAQLGMPPSDAIVLFDGKDLSQWEEVGKRQTAGRTGPPNWKVENGYFLIAGSSGDLRTKERFGDMQLHVEWAAPPEIDGSGQWRGNSGVILMGRYEIQVLDSWENPTYADGQAASIYGQYPPLVNASRKPGEWQTYDIVFEAPRFEGNTVAKKANVTVFHNGVLVHHRKEFIGQMAHKIIKPYEPHGAEEPLVLQNHDTKTRYRNVWVRRLKPYDAR